ncbi:MAG: iron-containing alcohol dehydrogenase [Deltaproteobacteria bacterium]|jgi:3-deoxy-alpha-D-manno-octulosonate 8-oxidase|nr:iron-containing alcohol dehydrogenase [Deltaproteobacteria bacterium]
MYRNVKHVPYYIFGKGSLAQLGDLLPERRKTQGAGVVFFIDHFFRDGALATRLPVGQGDRIIYVDVTEEPTTDYMDVLAAQVRAGDAALPCCMVALGGGATMDACKAVANLLTNPGLAEDYQGWELVKNPPVYKIAVPTLAGTGSECSRTCVLSNVKKRLKLGMNSDHTVFDQVIMDPELTRSVPRDQFFHTGMDTYMHCFETLTGSYRNRIVDALAEKAVAMCEDVFLSDDMMSEVNLEKMMIASYLGGMATGYVGVVHPFSAGLSVALHMRHGIANCYALTVLEDIYPEHHATFLRMLERQKVVLPKGVCRNLRAEDYEVLYAGTIVHENSLSNRLGPDFAKILSKENVIERFKRM